MERECFTIVVAVNDMNVLQKNLFLSPDIENDGRNQLIIKRNYRSASLDYNEAFDEAINDIVIFVHQDIYLPDRWFTRLIQALSYFEAEKINWGVLGCFGVREEQGKEIRFGRVYSNGWGIIGREIKKPEPVQTLDEIVLVVHKSSGLRFDPTLPHFHLYGTDICLSAREKGMKSYVIPASCIHNTNQILKLPEEFYECYHKIKRRWKKYLPIYTSCMRISRFNEDLYNKRIREFYARLRHNEKMFTSRVDDPRSLMNSE